jgi:hypothetical protein
MSVLGGIVSHCYGTISEEGLFTFGAAKPKDQTIKRYSNPLSLFTELY